MSEYGDDPYGSDEDWAYLDAEDVYDEIDDLLEHTCPSPTFPSNSNEQIEYDTYDYFNVDLEYLSDSYFDHAPRPNTGTRRKRSANKNLLSSKNSRTREPLLQGPVVWRSQITCREVPVVTGLSTCQPFALLQDWHERFQKVQSISLSAQESTGRPGDKQFNVDSLQSFAKLLVGDSLKTLKTDLAAKGLDPDAVQLVLDDLLSGQDRDFARAWSEDDEDDDHDDDNVDEEVDIHREDEEEESTSEELAYSLALESHVKPTSAANEAAEDILRHGRTRLEVQRSESHTPINQNALSEQEPETLRSGQGQAPVSDDPAGTNKRRSKRGREDHTRSDPNQTKRTRFTRAQANN